MAIKNRGRSGNVTLAPKWGFNQILLATVAILFVIGVATMPMWGRLFNRTAIAVSVPKPKTHITQVKVPPTKPTQPTSPTQPPQIFSANPVSIGEKMLGSYWEKGKLYYDGTYYGLLFTLPQGAELRTPFAGTVSISPRDSGYSTDVMVYPEPSLFELGKGNAVFYLGDSLEFLVKNGQAVTADQIIARVVNPDTMALVRGNVLGANVFVAYAATTPAMPHTYTDTSAAVLEEAFPYVKNLPPGQ